MGKRFESPLFAVQPGRPKQPTPSRAKPKTHLPKKKKGGRLKTAGKLIAGQKLVPLVEDREWLDFLRTQPGFITGLRAAEDDPVVPMHIGNPGKGLKNDAEAMPERQSFHAQCHQVGEMSTVREHISDDCLRLLLRVYWRDQYRIWKEAQQ